MGSQGAPPPLIAGGRILLPKKEAGSPSAGLNQIPESAPKKRKCISLACMPCRTRKSKCDGKQPSCSACTTVYSTECIYDIDSDRRRKGALKRDIKHLMEDNERRDIILEALKNASDAEVDDIVSLIRSDRNYEAIADALENMHLNTRNSSEKPNISDELSDFIGKPSLEKNGETRHYGHTSNLTILGTSDDGRTRSASQSGAWTSVTSDTELIKHLLNLYFAWSHPFYILFSQETFFYGMKERKTKYCTPLLVNALLSIGCHLSDRPEARSNPNDPTTAGDHFYAEAKRLLWEENDSSLTTVQALGVLSLRCTMAGQDNIGWRYAGQMMNMCVELGLHMSFNAGGKLNSTELEIRRITFWGCYVVQTAWSICVGRISFLPQASITMDKPMLRENLEMAEWKPYNDPRQDALAQPGHAYNLLLHNSRLTEIVNDIVHMFYAPQGRTNSRKLLNLYARLQKWYAALPECLHIQSEGRPTTAQVIALHMYYHNCVVHLFRPFLRVTFVQAARPPHEVCTEAARTITQLLTLYTQTYGLRRVCLIITHTSMTAAVQHLVDLQSPNETTSSNATTALSISIRSIHGMAATSVLSERFLKILLDLVRRWAITVPESVREAMREAEMGSPPSDVYSPSTQSISNGSINNDPQPPQSHHPIHVPRQPSSSNLISTPVQFSQLPIPPALHHTLPPQRQSTPGPGPGPGGILNHISHHPSEAQSHSQPNHLQQPPTQTPHRHPSQNHHSNHHSNSHNHINHNHNPHHNNSNQQSPNPFWTPFPDSFEGVPVAYSAPENYAREGNGGGVYMDISAMLDSGVEGDWAQLNRDGFTMADNSNSGVGRMDPAFWRWHEGS